VLTLQYPWLLCALPLPLLARWLSRPYAAQQAAYRAIDRAAEFGMQTVDVFFRGPGTGKDAAVRAIKAGAKEYIPLPPNPELCVRITRLLFGLLAAYTPLVEPTRPGSLFLDLSGTRRLFGPARDLAAKVRKEIRDRVGLEPRLGLAANKLLSRIATKVIPESSLCDVFPGGERHFLEPLDITVLPAVRAPACTERVQELNIERVSHLLPIELPALQLAFGRYSLALYRQARGLDVSPVRPPSRSPRITEEETLPEETNEDALLLAVLQGLAEEAGRRLRDMKAFAGRLELEIQYADTVLAQRACRLQPPTHLDTSLFQGACRLLELAAQRRVRIRRLTIHCSQIQIQSLQPTLFPEDLLFSLAWRQEALQHALDEIRERFGKEAIQKGQRSKVKGREYDNS